MSTCVPESLQSYQMKPVSPKWNLTKREKDVPMGPGACIPPIPLPLPHAHSRVCQLLATWGCPGSGSLGSLSLGMLGQAAALLSLDPSLAHHSAWLQSPGDSCHLPLPMPFSFRAKSSVKL